MVKLLKGDFMPVLMYKATIEALAKEWRAEHAKLFKRTENPLYDDHMKDEIQLMAKYLVKCRNVTIAQMARIAAKKGALEAASEIKKYISND